MHESMKIGQFKGLIYCYDELKRNYQYQKLKEEFFYIIDLIHEFMESHQDKVELDLKKEMLEKNYHFEDGENDKVIA